MKKLIITLSVVLTMILTGCSATEESDKPIVAVTIVPQAAFVEAIAGDLVEVVTIIPPGGSPASYEPTPQSMVKVADSSVYFSIGVPAEKGSILPQTDGLNIVELADLVNDVYPDRMFEDEHDEHEEDVDHEEEEDEHGHEGRDPHIWLSISRVKLMLEIMKDEIIKIDPENEEVYQSNYEAYVSQLDELDSRVKELFADKEEHAFLIYHPSFGYFADDYGLEMIELEEDGKEAGADHMQEIIDIAREHNLNTVFYQAEISSTQVEALIDELDAQKVQLDPLSKDYITNYWEVATLIADSLR